MEYLEIVKYRLKQGVTDEQFLAAEKIIRNGMIKDTKGYIGRELSKSEDEEWCLVLRYDTKENMDALTAALKIKRDSSFIDYANAIDFSTMRTEFFQKRL
jgi:antibiotic biosynthesis monooxygenase (ABM) superfamily enzyme